MEGHEHWSLLSAYVDGELSPCERSAVDAHVGSCASCREELAALSRAKALTASAPRHALPADLLAAIEERISRPTLAQLLRAWLVRPAVWVPAGATAVAMVCGGLWWAGLMSHQEELPLEPLLAAHSRYASAGLVPNDAQLASEFSEQLVEYHAAR